MLPKNNHSQDVHINPNVRGLKQSATLAINDLSAQLAQQGHTIYRFGFGQSPFPVPQPVVDELKVNAYKKEYLPVKGLWELRAALADHTHRHQGIDCKGHDVLIGPGSKELMFFLQLVYNGDLVIPAPSWVSYAPQAQIIGLKINWLYTSVDNDWKLVPEELDKFCKEDPNRPRIVVLNYPANPTGNSYSSDELKQLARIARQYKVILLSDEIYGELHHRGQHLSIAKYYPEGTIISGGLSKWCGAGGWRLGTFIFPQSLRWLLDAISVVASETFTSVSAPIQYAAIRAYSGGTEIESYLRASRKVLRYIGKHSYDKLKQEGATLSMPIGAFYLYPDFSPLKDRLSARGICDSATLCKRLLEETGVASLPGSEFGSPDNVLALRLAYVDFDGARVLDAHEEISGEMELPTSFLEKYCPNVTNGIDAICRWLNL